jgi:hypothetical protein
MSSKPVRAIVIHVNRNSSDIIVSLDYTDEMKMKAKVLHVIVYHGMTTCGGVEVKLSAFLISTQELTR